MEKLLLEAFKALESIRNREFLTELPYLHNPNHKPLTLRDFECFLEEASKKLNLTLEPFDIPNENQVYSEAKSVFMPIKKKAHDVSKIDVHNLYPQLVYNQYKDTNIPIMIIFKHLFESVSTTEDRYLRIVGKIFLNFFYGYSCGCSNLKYKCPNLSLAVLEFFNNLPDSVIAWDCDILFTKNDREVLDYLRKHNLNYDVLDNLSAYFIDKKSYLCYDQHDECIIDKTGFKSI